VAEVRWTAQALGDLEAITEFIARDSPYYASLLVLGVLAAVQRLERFQESGRIVPEKNEPRVLKSFSAITGLFTVSATTLPNS
jgi:plasmid stabilization system protein ParE